MRFVYILFDNEIFVEVQKNSNKINPFIRKLKAVDLEKTLVFDFDKTFLEFIKLLKVDLNLFPIKLNKDFISKQLITLIEKSNFIFTKKNKISSLKKINNLNNFPTINSDEIVQIEANKIKILIKSFSQHAIKVEYFFNFDNLEFDVPINYNFLIPILDKKKLAKLDQVSVNYLFEEFEILLKQNIKNSQFLSIEELSKLAQNNYFDIKYLKEDRKSASVSFLSNNLFKIKLFEKNSLNKDELDFFALVLQNYLEDKKYVDYNDNVIILNKNPFENIQKNKILEIFSYNLGVNLKEFIYKISNISNLIDKNYLLNKLKKGNFKGLLKNYQEDGVLWLLNLYKNDLDGVLLADEMGLGKTVQVIAFLSLISFKNTLIIAPASLLYNWKDEFLKFTNFTIDDIALCFNNEVAVNIVSYEFLRANINLASNYNVVILDESQKIKNTKTEIFKSAVKVRRDFTVVMTGTPIENSLNDLWSMFFAINSNLEELYVKKIKPLLSNIQDYQKAIKLTVDMFHPIILQRRKEEVLNLPKRYNKTILIQFSNDEKEKYKKLLNIFNYALQSKLSGRVESIILEGLLRLRQFCSIHKIIPQSLLNVKKLQDSKVEIALKIISKTIKKNEKIIIFSQFKTTLDELEKLCVIKNFSFCRLDGATTKTNRNKQIENFQDINSKFQIFLISLKAGGVGLNLTSAKRAILFEPWWNPAVEEQAFARIDRIGQVKKTYIYRLIYKNSIEEKIDNLINKKRGIFNDMSHFLNLKNIKIEVAKELFKL